MMGGFGGGMGMGRAVRGMDFSQLPKPDFSRRKIQRILYYFRPYLWKVLLVFICILFTSVLGLVQPMVVKGIFDVAIKDGNVALLNLYALAIVMTTMVNGLISVGQTYLNAWVSQRIMLDMRDQMFARLQAMSIGFYTKTKTGEIMSRINNDVGGVEGIISGTIVQIVTNLVVLATTLSLIFTLNWKLALLSIAILPLFILPTRRVGKFRWQIATKTQEKVAEVNSFLQEGLSISGALLTKVFNREPEQIGTYSSKNRELMDLTIKQQMAGRWLFMCLQTFATLGPAAIYWYGGRLVIGHELSPGTVIAFVALLNRLYGPVQSLTNVYVDLVRSLALFDRVFQYLDLEPEVADGPEELGEVGGAMEFQDVAFAYTEKAETLKGVSFKVDPGQMVALVGPSGAGKSTLTYLTARFYDPSEGRILLDGKDLKEVTLPSLRRNIGVVTQESYLFHATVKENLLFAKPEATQDELEDACLKANVLDVIQALPQGFDTLVGERGFRLSGGEKQRLAIARVILKNPKILVLDEATSSLDSVSEGLIQQALTPLMKGRTSFVVAHRLSTILGADKILVVENGSIVEEGPHEELLAMQGLYAKLYHEQFQPEDRQRMDA